MVKRSRLKLDNSLFNQRKESQQDSNPVFEDGLAARLLVVVVILAVGMVAIAVLDGTRENWISVIFLGIAYAASELFALPMKRGGRVSLALLIVVVAMLHSGPLIAAVIPLFGIPVFIMEMGGEGMKRVLYNTAQYVFCAGAAALVFHNIGGGLLDPVKMSNNGKLILPWIVATILFYALNTSLVTPVLAGDERLVRFWRRSFLAMLPSYFLYSGIGFLGAILYANYQFTGVVLLLVPLIGVRVVYTRFATMRDVCDDTTLAIMEAVEGSGALSEGHSVAVADMAVAMANEMNFQEGDVHLLRQASLLHDVGKLALDQSLLTKPGALTVEEYEKIQKHPLVGASIVSKQESFAEVAPAITHHHELPDGSGYVDGLAGDTIPVAARILAVADAFDAMQRESTYRDPLSAYEAASEIIRAKGVQFDPEAVDAFVKVVTKRGLWSGSLRDKVKMPAKPQAGAAASEEPRQPTLEDAAVLVSEEGEEAAGVTPAEGIKYTEVKDEIEKDIRSWKRSEVGKRERGDKRGSGGTGTKKKKDRKETAQEEGEDS